MCVNKNQFTLCRKIIYNTETFSVNLNQYIHKKKYVFKRMETHLKLNFLWSFVIPSYQVLLYINKKIIASMLLDIIENLKAVKTKYQQITI